jgi:hypothetical protein
MFTWYRRRKYREKVEATTGLLLKGFPGLYKSAHGNSKRAATKAIEDAFAGNRNPYELGLAFARGYLTSFLEHDLSAEKRADPLAMNASVNEVLDTLRGIPPEQRRSNRMREYQWHTDPENIRRKAEFLRSYQAR